MNHEEKLYNSFRIAKGDILENQKAISQLSEKVIELSEMFTVVEADNAILSEMLMEKLEEKGTAQSQKGNPARKSGKIGYHVPNQHVVPRDKRWAVVSTNSKKASRIYDKKADAISWANKVARDNKACMVVHNRDGTISRKVCS